MISPSVSNIIPVVIADTILSGNPYNFEFLRSEDGRYLVTGECGHLPSVRVWDLQVSIILTS